ncbi:S-methyl-5-thioribose-1-phosphate isomerase [Actinopolymorpha alba]|uniref:S-methyl-5-thioribose-1-phosphate isomerase n=1 Tax=Actinopolymorpha alba TaxID=533267 RepID=UPI00037AE6D5|nr:S-methyl-5-thioribose-1-phosphate isomerase [Actinopolymorpha alba]
MDSMRRTIDWDGDAIVIVDQCALPDTLQTLRLHILDELIGAIQRLAVRGAPALGAAGALGVALAARAHPDDPDTVRAEAERLAAARPTAVNLGWGVRQALASLPDGPDAVLASAQALLDDDERVNRQASARAGELILDLCERRPLRFLTHCNTGRLATVAWGTALGAVKHLALAGHVESVLVDETRPLLQGARLTAFELAEAGIPYRLCPDSAAATALARGLVDCVVVGADRIARNGDVANKVGTFPLALAAHHARVPFVVVAPESTLDPDVPAGDAIVVEERAADEVTHLAGRAIAPDGAAAYNPAFDITPAEFVTAIVTEEHVFAQGVWRAS